MSNRQRFSSLDEFNILHELGKGGYSVVYLVKHIKTGRKYALKAAMKVKNGKDRSKRTYQEIDVLSDLKHKHIIGLKGWFENEENIYLVLEYVSGGDLSKYFRDNLPSKEVVSRIMLQIVEAIDYCHQEGIIHRDMKLENILIDHKLKIKITDFGLCCIKNSSQECFYDEVGTVRYTSPELLKGEGYGESVDVWGIGIIFFMLLTGKYPFDGSKRESVFKRITHKTLNYEKYDLTESEIHLLKRLLCKNPQYRIKLGDIPEHPWFTQNQY